MFLSCEQTNGPKSNLSCLECCHTTSSAVIVLSVIAFCQLLPLILLELVISVQHVLEKVEQTPNVAQITYLFVCKVAIYWALARDHIK